MVGTVNADTLNGSGFNEIIYGGAADDVVSSEGGNDTVYGEEGNDTLHGGDGNDQLFGGAGNDTLTVNGNGSNTLDGGEGDDKLTINRSTDYNYQRDIARNMKNTLRGGTGNDRLEGSVSADTYLFNRGDGQDVINDFDQNAWSRTDRIVLGEGITLSDLNIRRIDNHLVLLIGDAAAGDSITIENAYTDAQFRIEQVVLADGTELTPLSIPEYVEHKAQTDFLVQAMSTFGTSESISESSIGAVNNSSLNQSLVVSELSIQQDFH